MTKNAIDNSSDPLAVTALSIDGGTYTFPTVDGAANQIIKTDGAGALTWYTPSGGLSFSEITTDTNAAVNNGYICNDGAVITVTLPATFAQGDAVYIFGKGAGGWRVEPNTGDTIYHLADDVDDSEYFASGDSRTCIRIYAITDNADWEIVKLEGDISTGP